MVCVVQFVLVLIGIDRVYYRFVYEGTHESNDSNIATRARSRIIFCVVI